MRMKRVGLGSFHDDDSAELLHQRVLEALVAEPVSDANVERQGVVDAQTSRDGVGEDEPFVDGDGVVDVDSNTDDIGSGRGKEAGHGARSRNDQRERIKTDQ